VEALRAEVSGTDPLKLANEPQSCNLLLLDSFIKESMRVNGSDAGKTMYAYH
jgi:hypothetical protein